MSPFTVLILIAFAVSAFGFIDEETKLNSTDELSLSEDFFKHISEREGRIVGGSDARRGQFPHQVMLRNAFRNFCGGSILNRRFVLTAARCIHISLPANIWVVVGAILRHNDGITHDVQSIHNHPEYTPLRRTNDISIIRTVNNILFDTPYVRPVKLPISNVPEAGNYKVSVSGWGHTSATHPGNAAETLQFHDGLTINREECVARWGINGRFVYENTVCVQNPEGRGNCLYDYGGALVTPRGVQVGVVSWGTSCGRGPPDVYANVWSHIEWIRAIIRLNQD